MGRARGRAASVHVHRRRRRHRPADGRAVPSMPCAPRRRAACATPDVAPHGARTDRRSATSTRRAPTRSRAPAPRRGGHRRPAPRAPGGRRRRSATTTAPSASPAAASNASSQPASTSTRSSSVPSTPSSVGEPLRAGALARFVERERQRLRPGDPRGVLGLGIGGLRPRRHRARTRRRSAPPRDVVTLFDGARPPPPRPRPRAAAAAPASSVRRSTRSASVSRRMTQAVAVVRRPLDRRPQRPPARPAPPTPRRVGAATPSPQSRLEARPSSDASRSTRPRAVPVRPRSRSCRPRSAAASATSWACSDSSDAMTAASTERAELALDAPLALRQQCQQPPALLAQPLVADQRSRRHLGAPRPESWASVATIRASRSARVARTRWSVVRELAVLGIGLARAAPRSRTTSRPARCSRSAVSSSTSDRRGGGPRRPGARAAGAGGGPRAGGPGCG